MSENARGIWRWARTACDDAEQDARDEVPHGHNHHDTRDCDILGLADAMSCIPERFLDQVDPEDKDERPDHHHRCKTQSGVRSEH